MRLARSFFLRVYLALLLSLLLFALLAGLWWRLSSNQDQARHQQAARVAGDVASRLIPAASEPLERLQESLADWHRRTSVDLVVFDSSGRELASAGRTIRVFDDLEPGFSVRGPGGPVFVAPLPDGRRLAVRPPPRGEGGPGSRRWPGFFAMLLLAAIAVALVAYPLARRLSARLERLERGVDALGRGDLRSRVKVEGHDEIAALARSFNRSAERIETLVGAQRSLLANASHELRSPLARIRMAVELLPGEQAGAMAQELKRDIAELDQLIEEILLTSRLDAEQAASKSDGVFTAAGASTELVGMVALCAEECARVDASLAVDASTGESNVLGDVRLLRRLLRNLLENARRYGGEAAVEVTVTRVPGDPAQVQVCVADRGPGVPEDERERIFEPFYRSRGASEKHGGVGLGLALVRQIARRHDGTVVCRGRTGGGSEFVLRLPAAAPTGPPVQ